MTAVTYTAKRSLIAGHVAGDTYSLDLRCAAGFPQRTRKVGEEVQRTLNDRVETLYYFGKYTWQLQLLVLPGEWPALEEFLNSTEGGEAFTFYEFGSVAVPGPGVTAKRIGKAYTPQRTSNSGATPAADFAQVSFDAEQA